MAHLPFSSSPQALVVCGPHDADRPTLEAVVSEVYMRLHGARITHFLPMLVGLQDASGSTTGVIGAAPLEHVPSAFLEAYLDEPIECALSRALGVPVARSSLVEVGNLATRRPGGGGALVAVLSELLQALGADWAVFTSTHVLRRVFSRLGVPLVDLGPADGKRLGVDLASWGRYYEHEPRVTAVRIEDVSCAGRSHEDLAPLVKLTTDALASISPNHEAQTRRRRVG